MRRIILAVTNDLVHDRRMHRIADALTRHGNEVTLVGRAYADSPPLLPARFRQVRMNHRFRKGKLFYIEYQCRLLWFLIRHRGDVLCAVDLDSLIPVILAGWVQGCLKVYDAHEYYTETPELHGRPVAKWIWDLVARWGIPRMDLCYTVGPALARELEARYHKPFGVVRNVPMATPEGMAIPRADSKILWYHGALNAGRGLEALLETMVLLPDYRLWIAGEGDLSQVLRDKARDMQLLDRVTFLGWVKPDDLWALMVQASVAVNLLEATSKSYYYSLANKAFDYIHALLPAIHMDFPEYRALHGEGNPGMLISAIQPEIIREAVLSISQEEAYSECQRQLDLLRHRFKWASEEGALIRLYEELKSPEWQ